jgi:hypothetical protein
MQPILDCIAICTIKLLGIEFQACLQHHFPRSVQEPDPITLSNSLKVATKPGKTHCNWHDLEAVFPTKNDHVWGFPRKQFSITFGIPNKSSNYWRIFQPFQPCFIQQDLGMWNFL